MKKEYETPKAEKMVFDYTDTIVTSTVVVKKNPNSGCTQGTGGQTWNNQNKCGGGAPSKNNPKHC